MIRIEPRSSRVQVGHTRSVQPISTALSICACFFFWRNILVFVFPRSCYFFSPSISLCSDVDVVEETLTLTLASYSSNVDVVARSLARLKDVKFPTVLKVMVKLHFHLLAGKCALEGVKSILFGAGVSSIKRFSLEVCRENGAFRLWARVPFSLTLEGTA